MDADEPGAGPDVQQQIDEIQAQMAINRGDIDALLDRTDSVESIAEKDGRRIDDLEDHLSIDRELILELQEAGQLNRDQVLQLEAALRSSRIIGAAIGIIMAKRVVTQDEAFAILKGASQNTNRKLRDLAEDLVLTGDAKALS